MIELEALLIEEIPDIQLPFAFQRRIALGVNKWQRGSRTVDSIAMCESGLAVVSIEGVEYVIPPTSVRAGVGRKTKRSGKG